MPIFLALEKRKKKFHLKLLTVSTLKWCRSFIICFIMFAEGFCLWVLCTGLVVAVSTNSFLRWLFILPRPLFQCIDVNFFFQARLFCLWKFSIYLQPCLISTIQIMSFNFTIFELLNKTFAQCWRSWSWLWFCVSLWKIVCRFIQLFHCGVF